MELSFTFVFPDKKLIVAEIENISAPRSRSMLMDLQEKCPHPAREDSFLHFSLNPNENCL